MLTQVDKFIGIPFLNEGRTIKGADCYGSVMLVYEAIMGKKLPDYSGNAFLTEIIAEAIEGQRTSQNWLELSEAEAGAIVLIKNHPVFVNHIGICVDRIRFAHCMRKRGFAIEKLDHPLWRNRIRGFYRYVG